MEKRVSIPAVNALKEALATIYWFKPDLKKFLILVVPNCDLISRLNWDESKRNIVTSLIDAMAKRQDVYLTDLIRLMADVAQMHDFRHLEKLDDGQTKASKAREAVAALSAMYRAHETLIIEQEQAEENRRLAHERQIQNKGEREKLESLNNDFKRLICSDQAQARGYELEKIINELFAVFDLNPKASYKSAGEQVDGAFTFEGTDFLLEIKWQKKAIEISALDSFKSKLDRKLDNTLGLFISVNGFSPNAIETYSSGRRMVILMDGSDLTAVLEERIKLPELLERKRRHAAQMGEIFLPVSRILTF